MDVWSLCGQERLDIVCLAIVFDQREIALGTEDNKFIATDLTDDFSTVPANGMFGLTPTAVRIKSRDDLCFNRTDTLGAFHKFIHRN